MTLALTQVSFAPGAFVKALWSGHEGFYAVDSDDTMYYWGRAFAGSSESATRSSWGIPPVKMIPTRSRSRLPVSGPQIRTYAVSRRFPPSPRIQGD